jgi:sec-independent protein translocase protein TatA
MQLLAGLGPLGVPELLIIALIVILVFGVGRLPEVGGAVGKSIREFRKATKDDEAAAAADASSTSASAAPEISPAAQAAPAQSWAPAAPAVSGETMFCSECGTKNLRSAKFCSQCGHAIGASAS